MPGGFDFRTSASGTYLTVGSYGAVGDGVTDDSAAIQAAHDALPASGGVLFCPDKYRIGTQVTITKPNVTILGRGMGNHVPGSAARVFTNYDATLVPSAFIVSSATLTPFAGGAAGFTMRDISVVCTNATPSAGAAVALSNGDSARFHSVRLVGFYDLVTLTQSEYAAFHNCLLLDPVRYGIYTQNTFNSDQGDMLIDGCFFGYSGAVNRTGTAAVRLDSGGGLRFVNNKINAGWSSVGKFTRGIDLRLAGGTNTSVLLIENNSIENVTAESIYLGDGGAATGFYGKTIIVGNEFLGGTIHINLDGQQQGQYTDIHINDNVFTSASTSAVRAQNVCGVFFGSATFLNCVLCYDLVANVDYWRMSDDQCFRSTNQTILRDSTTGTRNTSVRNKATRRLERMTPSAVTSSTPATMFTITPVQYGSVRVTVEWNGTIEGVAGFYFRGSRQVTAVANTSPVTVTTVGTDEVNTAYTNSALVTFSTATNGKLLVQVSKVAASPGTSVNGEMTVTVHGAVDKISHGADSV